MCKNSHPLCRDESDNDHQCPRRTAPESDADVLARALRWITEGADDGLGTTLTGRMCEVVAEELCARRIEERQRLRAVLYEVRERNPHLTNPATEHVTVIRRGADICGTCGYAITPTNHNDHGAGKCWPTPRRAS